MARGATVVAYDPMPSALERFAGLVPGVEIARTVEVVLAGADAAALITEWVEFQRLDWPSMATVMRRAVLVDGRNALAPAELIGAGFDYTAFGRGGSSSMAAAAQLASRELVAVMEPSDGPNPAPATAASDGIVADRPHGASLDLARFE